MWKTRIRTHLRIALHARMRECAWGVLGGARAHLVAGMNFSAFRFMDTEDLAERVEKLERKVEALSQANTTIALRMLQEFTAALKAAKAELDRRRAC